MLQELVNTANENNSFNVQEVTTVRIICDMIMRHPLVKCFSKYLTVPMFSATVECIFSTLHQLKSYLQSTMTQEWLNYVMVLHIRKDCTDNINLLEITKEFVSFNDRWINFFGHFWCLII